MAKDKDSTILSVVRHVCCGLDVHRGSVVATLIAAEKDGEDVCETKAFGAFMDDLERLRDWLEDRECPVVAMESTGI